MVDPVKSQQIDLQKRARASRRLVLKGTLLNANLAVAKMTGGILGHSFALIADGAESALDIVTSLLLWSGLKVAAEPPDADHPYGHGKAEALAGMVTAVAIFVTIGFLGWHSVEMILTPHQVPRWFTLPLLALAIIFKEIFSRRLMSQQNRLMSSALQAEAWHQRGDVIISVAAFIGITIAIIGGPGWETADDWAALAACVIILRSPIAICRASLNEMMDMAVSPQMNSAVRKIALGVSGVDAVEKCRTRKSGLGFLVDIHIEVRASRTVEDGHRIGHEVKDALLAGKLRISDVLVHIEPTPPTRSGHSRG